MNPEAKRALAVKLAELSTELFSHPECIPGFSQNKLANKLIFSNPFAFLVGTILDQGIPAERAWTIPWEMERNLGSYSITPQQISRLSIEEIRKSFGNYVPRYPTNMAKWIKQAGEIICRDYKEDTKNLWADLPSAKTLQNRLMFFPGIGQKKASMFVNLTRNLRLFGIKVVVTGGSEVSVDRHVKRVFVRTGFAEGSSSHTILEAARKYYPEDPAALDFACWVIGRTWCSPQKPLCRDCLIYQVCARDFQKDAGLKITTAMNNQGDRIGKKGEVSWHRRPESLKHDTKVRSISFDSVKEQDESLADTNHTQSQKVKGDHAMPFNKYSILRRFERAEESRGYARSTIDNDMKNMPSVLNWLEREYIDLNRKGLEFFLHDQERRNKPNTVRAYTATINRFLKSMGDQLQ